MKKGVITIGVLFIAMLMISTATAVPTTYSEPVMELIDQIEQQEEKIKTFDMTVVSQGFFNTIIQIIIALINLILKIVQIVKTVNTIVQLIQSLITGIQTLFQMIQDFIDLIQGDTNPEEPTF